MRTRGVELDRAEYDFLHSRGFFSPGAAQRLRSFFREEQYSQVVLFGSSLTGKAIQEVMGDAVIGFTDSERIAETPLSADALVIATAPVHYQEILSSLTNMPGLPDVVTVFGEQDIPEVQCVLETQPRSGTRYVMSNLTRVLGLGYASVFKEYDRLGPSPDGLFFMEPGREAYAVKAHFTRTLHYPAYRYSKTIFLFGYFLDSYHSWGRLLSGGRAEYRLTADSGEWLRLKAYLPEHVRWLEYISDRFWIRYEDFYHDFKGVIGRMEEYLGRGLTGFEPPVKNLKRMYWEGRPETLMDEEVLFTLEETFSPFLKRYYPEKA